MILYGDVVAQQLIEKAKSENNHGKLVIVGNKEDVASRVYIRNKIKKCEECGIEHCEIYPNESSTTEDYIELIDKINRDDSVSGVIVQLPLPQGIDTDKVVGRIKASKDVDGFTKDALFPPCTPSGIMHLLDYYYGEDFCNGKNAVVVGRSNIVGKPMMYLLLDRNSTVSICHSKTKNLKDYTANADIIVCAVGKPNTITRDMVKAGCTIIDVGINRVNDKLCGDCDFENLKDICDITPVPKGVGPLTVATLVERVAYLSQMEKSLDKSAKVIEKDNDGR